MIAWIIMGTICSSVECHEVLASAKRFDNAIECQQYADAWRKNTAMYFTLMCRPEGPLPK